MFHTASTPVECYVYILVEFPLNVEEVLNGGFFYLWSVLVQLLLKKESFIHTVHEGVCDFHTVVLTALITPLM